MDTSKEYIRMCEKAFGKEEPKGSWVRYSFRTIITKHGYWYDGNEKEGYIPLKTQDQLQKMVFEYLAKGNDTYSIFTLILDFSDFANCPCEFDSMEQLWIAFVMREIHSKVWDGKEWKKSGDELNETTRSY